MKNVLVVDDAVFMRKFISGCLEDNGFRVVGEAVDGLDAVKKYRDLSPDMVIMDLTMPRMNGLDAIKEITQIDPGCHIIVCSALSAKQMVSEAIKAGAKDYVTKPFEHSEFVSAIQKIV